MAISNQDRYFSIFKMMMDYWEWDSGIEFGLEINLEIGPEIAGIGSLFRVFPSDNSFFFP